MGSLTTNTLANQGIPSPADYVHFLRFLLDGVSQHVIPGDGRDLKRFRTEISTISGSLSERSSSEQISSLLNSGLQSLATYNTRTAKLVVPPTIEPMGKLSDRSAAEQSIAREIEVAKDCVCGVFLVNRLASISARFGRAIGDEVMLLVAERLMQHLPAGAAIFRWSESALVALAEVVGNISEVTRRYARAASTSLEKNIETEHRFVMVPITLSFTLKRLSGSCSPSDTFTELDRFVSVNTGETANMLQ
jgi:GGDEF domain-containing protein